jgi:hypothetical protein
MKEKTEKKINKSHLHSLRVHLRSRRRIFLDNLLGGIAWGVGSVIGATIVIGLLSFIFVRMNKVPLIGDIVEKFVLEIHEAEEETKDVLMNGE